MRHIDDADAVFRVEVIASSASVELREKKLPSPN